MACPKSPTPTHLGRLLGRAELVVVVIDTHEAEADLVAVGPLEVVHEGPVEVAWVLGWLIGLFWLGGGLGGWFGLMVCLFGKLVGRDGD